jgi:cytochrome P450
MLLEILRFSALVPLSVPHSAMEDTTLRGYFIAKGTTLIANLYAHHRNAKVFPDPDSFKPERFLTKDGKVGKNTVGSIHVRN